MQTYIALLRGINVGGKNKVSMPELRIALEDAGFTAVRTYINSGNIIFESELEEKKIIVEKIEKIIVSEFSLNIPVTVVSESELEEVLEHMPEWWGLEDKAIYHNAIFVIEPHTVEDIFEIMGNEKTEFETIAQHNMVIFWSANREQFNKTRWSKLASSKANNLVTVRNANTTRKLLELARNKKD